MLGQDGAASGGADDDLVRETTTSDFRKDVIAESARLPILVDFWAPWCGPCKQLTPVIEKAVRAAAGKVKLVKMNIDEHPQIAGQLGIQSIPAVIAFQRGQPVDGFMGAVPESQVKSFIERLVGPLGDPDEADLNEADLARTAGDDEGAAQIYAELIERDPRNFKAAAGLIAVLVKTGDLVRARATLASITEPHSDPAVAAAKASLELAEQASSLGDLSDLKRRVAANPQDHAARFDLAIALNAGGARTEAADLLLDVIKRDRHWNEDGARKQLVQFFEAWGPTDPDTIAGRRKLSALLFS